MYAFVNLYGCRIGDDTSIGTFVEIQKGVSIGARCKIQSHTFICEGVTIEDEVFVGHNVNFINDTYPRATAGGAMQTEADWTSSRHRPARRSLGTGSTIWRVTSARAPSWAQAPWSPRDVRRHDRAAPARCFAR